MGLQLSLSLPLPLSHSYTHIRTPRVLDLYNLKPSRECMRVRVDMCVNSGDLLTRDGYFQGKELRVVVLLVIQLLVQLGREFLERFVQSLGRKRKEDNLSNYTVDVATTSQ